MPNSTRPVTGIGLGLRVQIADAILARAPDELRWLEVSPENYLERAGAFTAHLGPCAERWPIVTHGLTMSLGGPDPLDDHYLAEVQRFITRVGSPWHSDHLCFASVEGSFLHDLLPLPFTREAVAHLVPRIEAARRQLDVPFALENVSYYAHPGDAEMDEGDFLTEVLTRTGAKLMFDVNNLYVNSRNHGFDPYETIARLPLDRVVQIHVAGHLVEPDGLRIDTHGEDVCRDVYELLELTLRRTGPVPVLLERDQNFPTFERLVEEIKTLDTIYQRATAPERA